ncbi:MAG: hypothetical protein PW843_22805 [Azospirillaceae bacterium]|nr:hypothetical protein [Azospirillaceae bacterium]
MDRFEAVVNLMHALQKASDAIEHDPMAGLSAPRAYPHLVRPGLAWVKAGRYWIAYRIKPYPIITGVFYETADIPRRL